MLTSDCPLVHLDFRVTINRQHILWVTFKHFFLLLFGVTPRLVSVGTLNLADWKARLSLPVVPDVLRQYQDFRGRQLVLTANNNWPYFVIKTLQDGRRVADSGIDVEIINSLANRLNFT